MITEQVCETDPDLQQMIDLLDQPRLDLILVEGFKHVPFPKIELHRPSTGHTPMYLDDANIIAFATDGDTPADISIPVLDLNNAKAIAEYVGGFVQRKK